MGNCYSYYLGQSFLWKVLSPSPQREWNPLGQVRLAVWLPLRIKMTWRSPFKQWQVTQNKGKISVEYLTWKWDSSHSLQTNISKLSSLKSTQSSSNFPFTLPPELSVGAPTDHSCLCKVGQPVTPHPPVHGAAFQECSLWRMLWGFPGSSESKESACQCRSFRSHGFNPWVRKIPWRRAWQPTPAFLPRESHGQKTLVSYSPWAHKRVRHNLVTKQQITTNEGFYDGGSWDMGSK